MSGAHDRSTPMSAEASALRPSPVRRDVSIRSSTIDGEEELHAETPLDDFDTIIKPASGGPSPVSRSPDPVEPSKGLRAKTLGVICLAVCVLGSGILLYSIR